MDTDNESTADIIVIGGGVVGVCTAYYLAAAGRSVTLLERESIATSCSYANACLVTPSHSAPIAAPGVIQQALKWLFTEDSPLLIRPRFDLALLGWLLKFMKYCSHSAFDRGVPVLRDLTRASQQLFEELMAREALSFHYERRGLMNVFATERGFEKGRKEAELLSTYGFASTVLDAHHARELEPAIRQDVAGAVYHAEDAHGDCYRFVTQLCDAARKRGVQVRTDTDVTGWKARGDGSIRLRTNRGTFRARNVVVAAGSWTPWLKRSLNVCIPVQPGKGYSITIDAPPVCPKIPLMSVEAKVAITPIGERLRFAGTMEFAGYDLTLKEQRVRSIRVGAERVLAGVEIAKTAESWCGLRPCTPDGLPILGRSPNHHNVFICTGHAMLGFTLGPISGKLISELIVDGRTSMPIDRLALSRF